MAHTYHIAEMTQYELEGNYYNLWATIKKEFPSLSIEDQVKIGSLVIGTCGTCHNDNSACQCWNDD